MFRGLIYLAWRRSPDRADPAKQKEEICYAHDTMKHAKIARLLLGGLLVVVLLLGLAWWFPQVTLYFAQGLERQRAGLAESVIEAANHRIAYLAGGAGDHLLLLHGFGANKDNWVRVARYLTPHFHVIAPDLPGFGESTRDPNARYAIDDQVQRLHAFVQALGLETFHLGGNSMGGNIAGIYAARYPSEIKSLWLLAPGGVATAQASELAARLAAGENPLLVDSVEGFDRLLDFAFVTRPYIPRSVTQYLSTQAIAHRAFNEKIFQDLRAFPQPLEPALQGFAAPTLITWGDTDRLLHVSGAAILAALVKDGHLAILEHTGHVPMIERPQESAQQFLRFRGISP
jgi:pimeloyl-ACP methyl ester carboxylesterase